MCMCVCVYLYVCFRMCVSVYLSVCVYVCASVGIVQPHTCAAFGSPKNQRDCMWKLNKPIMQFIYVDKQCMCLYRLINQIDALC